MTTERKLQVVLSAKDDGYTKAMQRAMEVAKGMKGDMDAASRSTSSFRQSMMAMASGIGITKLVAKGFDLIKGSVGSAMARVDTMDNFNRTMTLMSGSSTVAEKALSSLNTQARGTAYGLDVVARSTQGLTTSGIEIGKSTRYIGGWMDAVSTYGDGTNATLGNVTYQLSQMAAKGKANLGDLKSAMEAGIPVIQMYAEATGKSTEEVSKAISNGEISAEQFMEVMDRAFREGTKSFKSIEGAAKKAGGTWRGTFDNMQAATTRGVLSIVQSIEKARGEADLPGMKDAVSGFGKFMERSLNAVAKVAGFVAKHFDLLKTTVIATAAGFAAYKTITVAKVQLEAFSKAVTSAQRISKFFHNTQGEGTAINNAYANAINTVLGRKRIEQAADKLGIALTKQSVHGKMVEVALTEKQKVAILSEVGALSLKNIILAVLTRRLTIGKAAQLAFNSAIAANPVGALVVGVTLGITALKKLNDILNRTSKEHKKANAEAQQLADANKQLASSSKDLTKSYDLTKAEVKQNADEARKLVQRLKELEAQSGNTEKKQYQMKEVVGELNRRYPELNVELDKTGTALKGTTEALYKQIDAMEEAAKAQAMKDHLAELYKQQLELELAVESGTEKMAEMEEQGTSTTSVFLGLGSKSTKEFKALRESVEESSEALADNEAQIALLTDQMDIASQKQFEQQQAAEAQMKTLENLSQSYGVTSDQIVKYSERTGEKLEEAGNSVVALSEKYGLSTDQIIASVEAQNITLEEFAKNHENDLKRAEDAFKSYVENALTGLDQLEQKSAISLDAYTENLRKNAEATSLWSENVNKLMQAGVSEGMIRELEKLGPSGAMQAQLWVQELEELNGGTLGKFDELNSGAQEKITELQTVFNEGLSSVAEATDTSFKAQNYASLGQYAPEEIAKGIVTGMPAVEKESTAMGNAVQKGFDSGAQDLHVNVAKDNLTKGFAEMNQVADSEGRKIADTTKASFVKTESSIKITMSAMKATIQNSFTSIQQDSSTKTKEINQETSRNFSELSKDIKKYMDLAVKDSGTGWKNISSESGLASTAVIKTYKELTRGISSSFNPLPGQMKDAGYQSGMGLYYGLQNSSGSIYSLASTIANNVASRIRRALAIRSPSRVMMGLGLNTGEGFALGIEKSLTDIDKVTDSMTRTVQGINAGFDGLNSPVSGSTFVQKQPAFINLVIGGRSFRAFVENINDAHNANVEMELSYGS